MLSKLIMLGACLAATLSILIGCGIIDYSTTATDPKLGFYQWVFSSHESLTTKDNFHGQGEKKKRIQEFEKEREGPEDYCPNRYPPIIQKKTRRRRRRRKGWKTLLMLGSRKSTASILVHHRSRRSSPPSSSLLLSHKRRKRQRRRQ